MQSAAEKWLRAILAGWMIGTGGVLFLCVENRYMGSFLFGIGLFTILVFKLSLFTGKVGYAVQEKPTYLLDLAIIWLGNLIGTVSVGLLMLQTRLAAGLTEKAAAICQIKLNDNLVSILVLSVFCGMLMFLAADNFKKAENAVQKNIGIFMPVMVFILCGFEHCVANMFYFTVAEVWSLKTIGYLFVMSIGNALGAFIFPICENVFQKSKA